MPSSALQSDLLATYLTWTEQSLRQMRALVTGLAKDGAAPAPVLDTIYSIAHNIKGMGKSFGFPLMSEAGALFCTYLRELGDSPPQWHVLDAHVRCFEVIIAHRIQGDGGAMGAKLIDRLGKLVERAQAVA